MYLDVIERGFVARLAQIVAGRLDAAIKGWQQHGVAGRRADPLEDRSSEHLVMSAPFTLRDGRKVRIRPIHVDDADELQASFLLMSEASRFQRFHTGTPALSDRVARYLTDIDHTHHEALVAIDDGTTNIVGVARFIRSRTCPTEAELAIAVADDWHRVGLGTELLRLLADRARAEGIHDFTMEMLDDNPAILALVHRAGGVIEPAHDGVVSGRITHTRPE